MPIKSCRVLVLAAFGAALLSASAANAAPDAKQVADSLVAATAATDRVQATYEDATASGDVVTISGYKVTRTNAKTIVIPAIVVTGPVMRDAGGFSAESIAFDDGTATRGNDIVTWKQGLIEDATIPSAEEITAETNFRPFGKLIVGGLTISESNLAKPVTAQEIRVVMESDASGMPAAFAAQISGVQFPADVLKGRPQEKAIVDALGYENFDVNIALAGAFDAASNSMTLNTFTINTADVGTVSIKARFTGLSLGQIAATRLDAEARTDTKLDNLEIRFDNAGVVERALDMHAALIWGSRDDAVAQVNAALPIVLHFLGNDGFQAKIAKAFRTFLSDPKSIVFSAAPSTPVSLEQILDTTRSGINGLPDLLSADVTAN